MKFKKISLCFDLYGCPNRCKHCWIGIKNNKRISINDYRKYINTFKDYSDNIEVYSWLREPDYSDDYKELWEIDNELSVNSKPKRFELCSFYRIVRDEEYVKWLYSIGVRKCQLTLFGLEDMTDKYVGRRGAFKEIIKATNILLDNNIIPRWQMFVNKENIKDIDKVLTLIHEMNIKEKCLELGEEFKFFIHQGSCDGENEKLYNIRVTSDDIRLLPNDYISDLGKPECNLYNELINDNSTLSLASNEPIFYISNELDVYPNFSEMNNQWKLGNLNNDNIEAIIDKYINNKSTAQHIRSTIPISTLVKECGNPQSKRLFLKDDYVTYLLNKYCKQRVKN